MSVFALEDGVVYHTYSTYACGVDGLWGMYQCSTAPPRGATRRASGGAATTNPTTRSEQKFADGKGRSPMKSLNGIQAVVTRGASGVGRATVEALAAQGAQVRVVSRSADKLEKVKVEVKGAIEILQGDITDSAVVARSLQEITPDLLVLSAGQIPAQGPVTELTWESFSANWNNDVKSTFLFGQEVIRRPLRAGSTVVILSSGAALGGSPLTGGYGGAKCTQKLLALYLQGISDERKLGIRFVALVPKQMIAGTEIGDGASKVYAAKAGIIQEKFMERFGKPLTPQMVAEGILTISRGEGPAGPAIAITGNSGLEAMG
jgi:NAD(P)-dependent dehydrogenase (short-subunit alcohol dehydrogenase family)